MACRNRRVEVELKYIIDAWEMRPPLTNVITCKLFAHREILPKFLIIQNNHDHFDSVQVFRPIMTLVQVPRVQSLPFFSIHLQIH
jgi:hypothetical protein